MRENYTRFTDQEVSRFTELLVKMVKLQRLMRVATMEQQQLVFARASSVIEELVQDFGGDKVWCECLLTFGGQYFGQGTETYVGDEMSDEQLLVVLKREVERQENRR